MSQPNPLAPDTLAVLAQVRAITSVRLLFDERANAAMQSAVSIPAMQLALRGCIQQVGSSKATAAAIGLNDDAMTRLVSAIEHSVRAHAPAQADNVERRLDGLIANLRISRMCRVWRPAAFVAGTGAWPLLPIGDPRRDRLGSRLLAFERTMRSLVASCHRSEAALAQYLGSCRVLRGSAKVARHAAAIRLDDLDASELYAVLQDEHHTEQLRAVLGNSHVLGLAGRSATTLRLFLEDMNHVRNSVFHDKQWPVGEDSLHLCSFITHKFDRLIRNAVENQLIALPDTDLSLLSAATVTASSLTAAEPVDAAPAGPLDAPTCEALRELQSRTALRRNSGQRTLGRTLGSAPIQLTLVPDRSGTGFEYFCISTRPQTAADGATLLDAQQVERLLAKALQCGNRLRPPRFDELSWALTPYGATADPNPFGLLAPSIDQAQWVEDTDGCLRLVSLPLGRPDARDRGHLRLVWRPPASCA